MDKTKMKKVETFASIFGEDHNEVPSEKTDGTTSLKLDELIPFGIIHSSFMKGNDLMTWLRVLKTMV